ncbi:hypothetical protein PanWU01x14_357710 [Parasponia andersonii]|uniref:Uncharacterized protein n=1 Tax=Parasponia andersonii TaxID=3476 RepID=A0A2P5A8G8_PARAD|nr:hypothetical protein PanWU01x14_357710 [Parasponia andersonii]
MTSRICPPDRSSSSEVDYGHDLLRLSMGITDDDPEETSQESEGPLPLPIDDYSSHNSKESSGSDQDQAAYFSNSHLPIQDLLQQAMGPVATGWPVGPVPLTSGLQHPISLSTYVFITKKLHFNRNKIDDEK